jgi:hypothetical protein
MPSRHIQFINNSHSTVQREIIYTTEKSCLINQESINQSFKPHLKCYDASIHLIPAFSILIGLGSYRLGFVPWLTRIKLPRQPVCISCKVAKWGPHKDQSGLPADNGHDASFLLPGFTAFLICYVGYKPIDFAILSISTGPCLPREANSTLN